MSNQFIVCRVKGATIQYATCPLFLSDWAEDESDALAVSEETADAMLSYCEQEFTGHSFWIEEV